MLRSVTASGSMLLVTVTRLHKEQEMDAVLESRDHQAPSGARPAVATRNACRWEVRTPASVATVRARSPYGRVVTARFREITGLVDLSEPGSETIALLVGTHGLDLKPNLRRRRWLGPELLHADRHPHLAVVLDRLRPQADEWAGAGRLHVRRQVVDVEARVRLGMELQRCTIAFAVGSDSIGLGRRPVVGWTRSPTRHHIGVVMHLSLAPRDRRPER